jgi:hypothetical protein
MGGCYKSQESCCISSCPAATQCLNWALLPVTNCYDARVQNFEDDQDELSKEEEMLEDAQDFFFGDPAFKGANW